MAKNHIVKEIGKMLLSIALGALSTADKHYYLCYLCAPALLVSAKELRLSIHGIMLGQLCALLQPGMGKEQLPVLLFLYTLRLFFADRRGPLSISPGALGGILCLYEVMRYFFFGGKGTDLLLGLCGGILSGCAVFFIRFVIEEKCSPTGPRYPTALILVDMLMLMLTDTMFLEGILLQITALVLILLWGQWHRWQCIMAGCVTALAATALSGRSALLPFYLSGVAAVSVMQHSGRKKYAAAVMLAGEIALLPTGLWLEYPWWLISSPIAALLFILLPLPIKQKAAPTDETDLTTQYEDLVRQVDKLSAAAGQRISFYPEIAARGSDLLAQAGAQNINVTCAKDLLGGFFLDVSFDKGDSRLTPSALLGLMERAGGFALAKRRYHDSGEQIYACFVRRPPYTVQCAALCKIKDKEAVCGDSALAFSTDQSHYVLLLSDGMGSGKDAFAQSCWTVTLLQKLLRAGLKAEGAIGMVHSSLKLAQQDIAFATVDLCSIDLWRGTARFVKAGAVSTFILRGKEIIEVCAVSMPLGAAEVPDVAASGEQLQENDLILLISDGAFCCKDEILYTLQKHRSLPVRQLAEKLMQSASTPGQQAEDDITILVARFCKNE